MTLWVLLLRAKGFGYTISPRFGDHLTVKLDRLLGLSACVMRISGGKRLVTQKLAHDLIMARQAVQEQLGRCMAELVRGQTDRGMGPERVGNELAQG